MLGATYISKIQDTTHRLLVNPKNVHMQ